MFWLCTRCGRKVMRLIFYLPKFLFSETSILSIFIACFSIVVPLTSCVFFPVGLSSLTRHFNKILYSSFCFLVWAVDSWKVNCLKPGDRRNYTRPVENVTLTTKAYRKENTTSEWDDGGKMGNKKNSNSNLPTSAWNLIFKSIWHIALVLTLDTTESGHLWNILNKLYN